MTEMAKLRRAWRRDMWKIRLFRVIMAAAFATLAMVLYNALIGG